MYSDKQVFDSFSVVLQRDRKEKKNIKSIKMFFAPHFHVDKFEISMSGVGLKKVYTTTTTNIRK